MKKIFLVLLLIITSKSAFASGFKHQDYMKFNITEMGYEVASQQKAINIPKKPSDLELNPSNSMGLNYVDSKVVDFDHFNTDQIFTILLK